MKIPLQGAHYRPEIDGLRALAVIAVVLYHARLPFLTGGFAGVDVFFAISGYVVIGTLQRELHHAGRIDWARFAIRRARRLMPMLWLTILLSLAAGYWLLSPFGEFQQLCKSAIAALGLSANLFFWRYAGSYFSPGFDQLPLMHLWSLSVEEQFYLLVPAVFLLARWPRLGGFTKLATLLTLVSFALAVWGTQTHPTATFYLPITRAWEFALGALATRVDFRPLNNDAIRTALLTGIVTFFFLLTPDAHFQPLQAGLPAVLTALWLGGLTNRPATKAVSGVLRQPWLGWVGRRAYAWYLLHWPVLVFYRQYWQEDTEIWELLVASACSLLLAALAYRYVELPARYRQWRLTQTRFKVLSLAGLTTASLATLAMLLGTQASLRQSEPRWHAVVETQDWMAAAGLCMRNGQQGEGAATVCRSPHQSSDTARLFLWGDSHAYHLWPSLNALSSRLHMTLRTWSMGGCPPLAKWPSDRDLSNAVSENCRRFEAQADLDISSADPAQKAVAIMAARWEPYARIEPISLADRTAFNSFFKNTHQPEAQQAFSKALQDTVDGLEQRQVQIILVAPIPEQRVMVPTCLQRFGELERCSTLRSTVEKYRATTMQMLQIAAQRHPSSVQLVDPINLFCDERLCRSGSLNEPWYIDDDHLSKAGARKLEPMLTAAITEAKQRLGVPASKN